MTRLRVGCWASIGVGVGMIAIALAIGLPSKFGSVQRMTDDLRPVFTDASVEQINADYRTLAATGAGLQSEVLPALAQAQGTTPDELAVGLGRQYPAVGRGLAELDRSVPYFGGLVAGITAQQDNFRRTDALPVSTIPASPTIPLLLIIPGAFVALLGAATLLRPTATMRRIWLVGTLGTAVALCAIPLLAAVPGKLQATERLTDAFRPAFTDRGLAQTRAYMDNTAAMVRELQTEAIPGLAEQLGQTPDELVAVIARTSPDVGRGLGEMDGIVSRFDRLVAGMEANAADFRRADELPTGGLTQVWLFWLFVAAGVLLAVAVAISALRPRLAGGRTPVEAAAGT